MKKILSEAERKKKQKRNGLIIAIILVGVMVLSTFGVVINSFGSKESSSKIKYKDNEFVYQNSLWFTKIGNLLGYFRKSSSVMINGPEGRLPCNLMILGFPQRSKSCSL